MNKENVPINIFNKEDGRKERKMNKENVPINIFNKEGWKEGKKNE